MHQLNDHDISFLDQLTTVFGGKVTERTDSKHILNSSKLVEIKKASLASLKDAL
jgi:hypothetical protein